MAMSTRKIRTLIVDDEPLARERVRSMAVVEALGPVKRWTQRNKVT